MGLLSRFGQAFQPPDASWAAYDPGVAGPYGMQMPQQAPTDAAAAAYSDAPQAPGFDMRQMGSIGMSLMQQAQPQRMNVPPPQQLDPYRFMRGRG